jgi:hypothetical protein
MTCTEIAESSDPNGWNDNFFCTQGDYGIRWSSDGAIRGMRCTQIFEGCEPPEHAWHDNFLCVPQGAGPWLSWSQADPIPDRACLSWNEPEDPQCWGDNFLCLSGIAWPGGPHSDVWRVSCTGATAGAHPSGGTTPHPICKKCGRNCCGSLDANGCCEGDCKVANGICP